MTITQCSELRSLEKHLKYCLRTALPESQHWPLQCGAKLGKLVVLVQHSSQERVNQPRVFHILESAFKEDPVVQEWMARSPDLYAIRFYLRRLGEPEPYGFYRLAWETELPLEAFFAPGELFNHAPTSATPPSEPQPSRNEEPSTPILLPMDKTSRVSSDLPLALPLSYEQALPEVVDVEATAVPVRWRWKRHWKLPKIPRMGVAAAIAAALMLGVGGSYALTRPCVVGQCATLATAQELQDNAAQKMVAGTSAQDVVKAYESLMEATYLLDRIPPWSPHYETAQGLMQSYAIDIGKLERVVLAQRLAMAAAVKSQNPPHPLTVWREVQQGWQGAIAQLEKVPQDSPIYDLAQHKLKEYQSNLSQIDQRIRLEVEAQEWVNAARKTAKEAETRQGVAQSAEGWEQTRAAWQAVLDVLARVPNGTMAYAESLQLAELYRPQLKAVEDRLRLETQAGSRYERALRLAQAAQDAERRNRWGEAAAQWQLALAELRQVQRGSTSYDLAQSLLASYEAALTNSQERQRVSGALQAALRELEPLCAGRPRACTYEPVDNRVEVRMTRAYEQALDLAVSRSGITPVSTARMNYMNPVLQAIASVGETSNTPIELYEAEGNLFGIYDPRVDGFVSQLAP